VIAPDIRPFAPVLIKTQGPYFSDRTLRPIDAIHWYWTNTASAGNEALPECRCTWL